MRPVWVLCAIFGLAPAARAGTISGQIELLEKGGKRAADASEVVVYLDGVKLKPKPVTATVTMKGKAFLPHVVVIPAGGTVAFPNEDPIFHNVFSISEPNRFDLDLYKRPKTGSHTFQHPGVARVYCNIHPQMSAVVVVRDNPFYAQASREGGFSIEGVPAGRYTLKAWHERAGEVAVDVNVSAEGQTSAKLTLDASSFRRVSHSRKDGSAYGPGEKY